MGINLSEIEVARSLIAATATKMLAGELSYIDGSRAILAALPAAQVDNMDEFMAFVGIDSETDRFPVGATRDQWQSDALESMHPELDKAENWAKSYGEPACIKVIERFEKRPFEF